MSKYYVESGPNLMIVVEASDVFEAIINALEFYDASQENHSLELADVIIVNEKGFVWQRPNHVLYGEEIVLPTALVLGEAADPLQEFGN